MVELAEHCGLENADTVEIIHNNISLLKERVLTYDVLFFFFSIYLAFMASFSCK